MQYNVLCKAPQGERQRVEGGGYYDIDKAREAASKINPAWNPRVVATAPTSDEEALSQARDTLQKDYFDSVRAFAKEADEAVGDPDVDDLQDWLHEQVDDSYWVIYYHAQMQCLMCSDNKDTWEDMGAENPSFAVMAFYALQADILAYMQRDPNDAGDVDCEECGDCYWASEEAKGLCGDCRS